MADHPNPDLAPIVAFQFDDADQQHESATLGMWGFLITELMFFGGLFGAYIIYRVKYGHDFLEAGTHLDWKLGALNTCVLLVSSLTMALAVRAAQLNARKAVMGFLAVTLALGAVFLVVKGFEYGAKIEHGFLPWLDAGEFHYDGASPRLARLFLVFYFVMTGIHGLHIVIGLGLLAWLIDLARRQPDPARNYNPYEVVGLYWHFVDIVWIFLYPVLYLSAANFGGH